MLNQFRRKIREKGQGLTEYVLILAFVAGIAFMMFGGNGSLKGTLADTLTETVRIFAGLFDEDKAYAGYFTDWRRLSDADLASIENSKRIKADYQLMFELAKTFIGKNSDEATALLGRYTTLDQDGNTPAAVAGDGEHSNQLVLLATWDHFSDNKNWTTLGRPNQGNYTLQTLTNNEAEIKSGSGGGKTNDRVFFSDAMTLDTTGRRVTAVLNYGSDHTVESVSVIAQTETSRDTKIYVDIPGYNLTVRGSSYTVNE